MENLSTLEIICYLVAFASMVLCVGTFGAIETGGLGVVSGMIRCAIFLAIAAGSVFAGRKYT